MPDASTPTPQTEPLGQPGVPIWGGWIADEWEPKLKSTPTRLKAFKEMGDSHPLIAVALLLVADMVSGVEFRAVPADESPAADAAADLLARAIAGVDWPLLLFELCFALRDGYNLHEVVYRPEGAEWLWARFEPRRALTIDQWLFEGEGGSGAWLGVVQQTVTGTRVEIPAERLVHVVAIPNEGNPEGKSVLRSIYATYRRQAAIERIMGIGVERKLAGIPMFNLPSAVLANADQKAEYQNIGRNIRQDEQTCLVLPPETDREGKPTGFKFSLVSSAGDKGGMDVLPIVQFYDSRIATALRVQFLLLGAGAAGGKVGSFSLASSHTDVLATGIGAFLTRIARALDLEAQRLQEINGIPPEVRAHLHHGDIEKADLEQLSTLLGAMTSAGMSTADPALEAHVRDQAGFPPVDAAEREL